jgi:hypothetical protein
MQSHQKQELQTALAIAVVLAIVCFGAASFAASFIAKTPTPLAVSANAQKQ